MTQKFLILVHGGESWENHEEYLDFLKNDYWIDPYRPNDPFQNANWKEHLRDGAYAQGYEVFKVGFPCSINAKYNEWRIVGERILKQIPEDSEVVLLGHSLGGNFLIKFLAETDVSHLAVQQVHLVAACHKVGDFTEPTTGEWANLAKLPVHVWQAEDDTVVPVKDARYILNKIPNAIPHILPTGGHFAMPVFAELEAVVFGG